MSATPIFTGVCLVISVMCLCTEEYLEALLWFNMVTWTIYAAVLEAKVEKLTAEKDRRS